MTYTNEDGHVEEVDWGHHEVVYFSFGPSQTLLTQNQDLMQAFLDGGGYLGGFETVDSEALLILQVNVWLGGDESLEQHVVHRLAHRFDVIAHPLQLSIETRKRPMIRAYLSTYD